MRNLISTSLNRLNHWIETNGWSGFDPYDIKEKRVFLLSRHVFPLRILSLFAQRYPLISRRLFGIKPQINPKAMALFARGYLCLYKKCGDEAFLQKALFCLEWLKNHSSKSYSGYCWGYPFDWHTIITIPKGTPSSVVTSVVAHAFLDAYELLGEEKYLNVAIGSCNFFLRHLNIHFIKEDKLCFSYTPLDFLHVHNANMFSASVLLRTYSFTDISKYRKFGEAALNYTMNHQNSDGSWYYFGPPTMYRYTIDNYHTGFVLECTNIARRSLGNDFIYSEELKKGLDFYSKKLFEKGKIPRFSVENLYPIDIHSCAQGIITFSELADFRHGYEKYAYRVAEWSIKNMQDKTGFFYYRIYRYYVDKTPYIRWGQAWMFRGLSYIL